MIRDKGFIVFDSMGVTLYVCNEPFNELDLKAFTRNEIEHWSYMSRCIFKKDSAEYNKVMTTYNTLCLTHPKYFNINRIRFVELNERQYERLYRGERYRDVYRVSDVTLP